MAKLKNRVKVLLKVLFNKFFYFLWSTLALGLAKIFFKMRYEGIENLPKNGPYILAANHQNFADGVILSHMYNPFTNIVFIIHKRSLNDKVCWAIANTIECALTGNATHEAISAMKKLSGALKKNKIVGIFPEGDISGRAIPKTFKPGVAKLAVESGVPVIPIFLNGTFGFRKLKYWFSKPEVLVRVGKPMHLSNANTDDMDFLSSMIRDQVVHLSGLSSLIDVGKALEKEPVSARKKIYKSM